MKKCANTSPKLQPKQRIVRTPPKLFKNTGVTHTPTRDHPPSSNFVGGGHGWVCVLWVGLVVCVVGGVWVCVGWWGVVGGGGRERER